MTSLDKQLEELISERNAFEVENISLKAQVNQLLKACKLYGDGIESHASLDEADTIVIMTPEQCVESIGISAIRDLARTECPASGYIITSEESRKQMIGWADFVERCNNEQN